MRTNMLLTNHRLSVALADQRTARVRRHATRWFRSLRATLPDDPQRLSPLLRALGGSRRLQQRATAIILALGAPGGAALAALLPATIAAIEAAPPKAPYVCARTMRCCAPRSRWSSTSPPVGSPTYIRR